MYVHDSGNTPFERKEPTIELRSEKREDGSRLSLWAYLDTEGRLHIEGQDLGPITKVVSSDGEYEYFKTIAAEDIPRLIKLLGSEPGDNVLDVLEQKWTGERSFDLEELLEKIDIRVALSVWSG